MTFDKYMNHWWVLNQYFMPIAPYDTVESVDVEENASIPTEPIEGGKLASFNKVNEPSSVNLTLLFSGNYVVQMASLELFDMLKAGTQLCLIVSPRRIYRNMALENYQYSATAGQGGHLLAVQCSFKEVISVDLTRGYAEYSPKNPTSANKQGAGKVQAVKNDSLSEALWKGINENATGADLIKNRFGLLSKLLG